MIRLLVIDTRAFPRSKNGRPSTAWTTVLFWKLTILEGPLDRPSEFSAWRVFDTPNSIPSVRCKSEHADEGLASFLRDT